MADFRFDLDFAGFDELRKSSDLDAIISASVRRIASAAGPGFEAGPVVHGINRSRSDIHTTDFRSRVKNARENTLLRALDAGRV